MFLWSICTGIVTLNIICCHAHNEPHFNRSALIQDIKQKMLNISVTTFSKARSNDTDRILTSIYKKLNTSVLPSGRKADRYIQLIMSGLRAIGNNITKTAPQLDTLQTSEKPIELRRNFPQKKDQSKEHLIREVSKKMFDVSELYLRNAKTEEEVLKIIDKIKYKILGLAGNQTDFNADRYEKYADLIARGMEMQGKPILNNRRMGIALIGDVKYNKYVDETVQGDFNETKVTRAEEPNKMLKNIRDVYEAFKITTTENPVTLPTLVKTCDDLSNEICFEMKELGKFSCLGEKRSVPIIKLCDGSEDCVSGTDETKCEDYAVNKLQTTMKFMGRIENYLLRNCHDSRDNYLLIKQNLLLAQVLQNHIHYINKYKASHPEYYNVKDFKITINEIAMVINTLSVAFDSSLCSQLKYKSLDTNISFGKFMNIIDDEADLPALKLYHFKNCLCDGMACKKSNCTETCKYVCWFKHSLGRFSCPSVDQMTSVSLDVVCDGKFDCFYEADEKGCHNGSGYVKFEANNMFTTVLKTIITKSSLKDYALVHNKLMNLYNLIQQLQHEVMNSKDISIIKSIRNDCFSLLMDIYHNVVNDATSSNQVDDAEIFLLSINEKLTSALKKTHTGNSVAAAKDDCFCRGLQCALSKCSKKCERTCKVQSRFTRYWCKNVPNVSLPIENVCDGNKNCPHEDDEANCNKDVCRKHHLLLLRHIISKEGDKNKWANFEPFMEKVNATLAEAEALEQHTPAALRDTVKKALMNLVHVYAEMKEAKKMGDEILLYFTQLSQRIIEILKTCGV